MEFCPEHGKLMEAIGHIKGQNEILLKGQEAMFEKIGGLTVNGAVQKTRLQPIFWVITTVIGGLILAGISILATHAHP